jgi:hypothetical protein
MPKVYWKASGLFLKGIGKLLGNGGGFHSSLYMSPILSSSLYMSHIYHSSLFMSTILPSSLYMSPICHSSLYMSTILPSSLYMSPIYHSSLYMSPILPSSLYMSPILPSHCTYMSSILSTLRAFTSPIFLHMHQFAVLALKQIQNTGHWFGLLSSLKLHRYICRYFSGLCNTAGRRPATTDSRPKGQILVGLKGTLA